MANWILGGCLGAAVSAFGLADYADQSRMTGVPLGEIGFLDYLGQYGVPSSAHRAEMQPPAEVTPDDPRVYLPQPPGGWVRRHWTEGDNTWLHKDRKQAEKQDASGKDTVFNRWLAKALTHRDVYAQRRAFSSGWVYEQGDDIIFIGADVLEKPGRNSIVARGVSGVDSALNRMTSREGFAVVQGMPFVENKHEADTKRLFRSFEGRLGYGQEIRVRVRSHTTEAALRDFLGRIDYTGLNGLLDAPVPGIGPDALELGADAKQMLAAYAFEIRDALEDMSKSAARDVLRFGAPMQIAIAQIANGSAAPEVLSSAGVQDRAKLAAYAAAQVSQ